MRDSHCVRLHWQAIAMAVGAVIAITTVALAQRAETSRTGDDPSQRQPAAVKPLTKEQQDKLLGTRLPGEMGASFGQFSNRFLVMSRINLSYGVGLMTSSDAVAKAELHPVFPKFYRPTLREFLDAIALQTSSEWKYDPTSKYVESEGGKNPVEDLAIFEFTETKREKPFKVTLPKGWKAIDKGNWVMYVPPIFPLAVDIHEVGDYSTDNRSHEKAFFKKVMTEVSLQWASQARDNVEAKELKPAQVGAYDALYFETTMPLRDGSTFRWRQWVFFVENKCYFAVSTIAPEFEDRILPHVQAILKSFEISRPEGKGSSK